MRKVLFQMIVSIDGFAADSNGGMSWGLSKSDEISQKYVDDLLASSDLILLGRNMVPGFIDYWSSVDVSTDSHNARLATKINKLPKIVFSKTLGKVDRPGVTVIKDNIAGEIARLKQQPGKNIILYGGVEIARTFAGLNLIDEYHLIVAPVILGKGLSLFHGLDKKVELKLIKTTTNKNGVVIFCYVPADNQ